METLVFSGVLDQRDITGSTLTELYQQTPHMRIFFFFCSKIERMKFTGGSCVLFYYQIFIRSEHPEALLQSFVNHDINTKRGRLVLKDCYGLSVDLTGYGKSGHFVFSPLRIFVAFDHKRQQRVSVSKCSLFSDEVSVELRTETVVHIKPSLIV